MNLLLAFKVEPDAGMVAEQEWQAATQDTCGPDLSLLRCAPGADEQAAAALLLAQRREGVDVTLTALSIGDERALYWLRYFAALGFDRRVLLETPADIRFAPVSLAREMVAWQRLHGETLIVTGCQSSEGQNGQTPFLVAEMLGWPCLTQVERFTLEPPFVVAEQRTSAGLRCCRVRLPALIGVRQCGEVALPVPGMRQRLAAAKAEIQRQPLTRDVVTAIQCQRLVRPLQRRTAAMIEGATAEEKARTLWETYLYNRMQP